MITDEVVALINSADKVICEEADDYGIVLNIGTHRIEIEGFAS